VPHAISKEPMYKGKLSATVDTFAFLQLVVVETPFHAQLFNGSHVEMLSISTIIQW
jgi:hypothetical protein